MKRLSYSLLVASLLAGCATKSEDIQAAYVSPMKYSEYSCSQLNAEAQRVSTNAARVSGAQDAKASSDAGATAVSLILFWPAVFMIDGDSALASEVALLKGEMRAIEQSSIQKNCGLRFS